MNYFIVGLKYKEPVADTDEMKSKSVKVLVNAETCTDAETKITEWLPSNWKEANVKSVSPASISEVQKNPGDPSETWWQICLSYQKENGKWFKTNLAANGSMPEEVIKRVILRNPMSSFISSKRLSYIIDSDLT